MEPQLKHLPLKKHHILLNVDDSMSMHPYSDSINQTVVNLQKTLLSPTTHEHDIVLSISRYGTSAYSEAENITHNSPHFQPKFNGISGSSNVPESLTLAKHIFEAHIDEEKQNNLWLLWITDGFVDDYNKALHAFDRLSFSNILQSPPQVGVIGVGKNINRSFLQKITASSKVLVHLDDTDAMNNQLSSLTKLF